MSYSQQSVSLELDTDVTHQCFLHHTRDEHLIGIIEFNKPSYILKWEDFMELPQTEDISEVPILPWRLLEEDCPVRLVVPQDRLEHYIGLFEPTWLNTDVDTAIQEIREFMDMFVH